MVVLFLHILADFLSSCSSKFSEKSIDVFHIITYFSFSFRSVSICSIHFAAIFFFLVNIHLEFPCLFYGYTLLLLCYLFLADIYFVSTWSDVNISTHFPILSVFICFFHPFTFNLPISSCCVWSKLPVDSKYSWFILYNLHNICF